MSTLLLLALIAFGLTMVFAFVVGGWRKAMEEAPRMHTKGSAATAGLVSLVIPARNAEGTLASLLQDLYAQAWPKEAMEVLVVDDGSSDGTARIVSEMAHRWSGLRLIASRRLGKKAAIAHGVAEARGEWVLLTDADARCGPLRLSRIMQEVAGNGPDMLVLPVATRGTGWLRRVQVEEQAALLGVAAGTAMQGRAVLANGANMAFRKVAFLAVGGYDGDTWASGDDLFLLRRMQRHGKRVAYLLDPAVVVTVEAEGTLREAWRQRLRWAGKMRALGPGVMLLMAGILLPWFLLFVTCSMTPLRLMAQRPLLVLLLLASSWMLWLLPVMALVRAVRRFLQQAPHWESGPAWALPTVLSLFAFSLYAPVVAVASMVIRPRWKGRRL